MAAAVLIVHAAVAVLAAAMARRLGTRAFFVAALAPLASLVWLASEAGRVLDGEVVDQRFGWVDELGVSIDLRLDGMSLLMGLLISGVGLLVLLYSRWYFGPRPGIGRIAGILVAFSGAMLGVVLADNLLVVYVFWELTSVTSYLLIGTDDTKGSARAAALQAILVTGAGGLAMLGGFVLIGQAAGTYSLSGILESPPGGTTTSVGLALVVLGALTKSAQVPFHAWLPGAMAAPTPISAYLHSATMVKAGVYLLARFAPAFADGPSWWRPVVVTIGVLTMLLGALRALRQHDLKLLLAFGTVSQLGFMVALVGAGHPDLTFAGAAVILAHGLFKAALFLVVGIVDHQAHTRDVRRLSGLWRTMPVTFAVAAISIASMAGVAPLLGFAAKEAAYEALLHDLGGLAVVGIAAGSVLTFAYGARFLWGGFATKPRLDVEAPTVAPRPASAFLAPAALLGALTLLFGLLPYAPGKLARAAARSLDADVGDLGLYLWHGVTTALLLSLATIGIGVLFFLGRRQVEEVQARFRGLPSSQRAYEAVLSGALRTADRSTAFFQNGSLPVYIGVILITLLVLPGWVLASNVTLPDDLVLAESPLQAAVAGIVIAGAIVMALTRRRLAAVLALGAVGFGVAVLFVIQGAPDLALTQLLVETLALVVFVLVLRHLPEQFEAVHWRLGNGLRLAIAAGVGVFVTIFALVAASARTATPVSEEQLRLAEPEGGGQNVVNVILVDIRALDTLGEITVLAVAGLGIASLVLAGRSSRLDEDG